jgi:hypothetical protein
MTPYHQSKKYDTPKLEGESHEDYDRRTWRGHLHLGPRGSVVIPARAMHQSIVEAGAYTSSRIPGQGTKTWTRKFMSGLAIFEDIDLGLRPEDVDYIDIYAHANGIRGGGPRVNRRYPAIREWSATFQIHVLDPIITQPVFQEALEVAGLFIGIGQYRPQMGGTAGRFQLMDLGWNESLQPVFRRSPLRRGEQAEAAE